MRHTTLLIWCVLVAACANAGGALVIGDSITAEPDNWTEYVDQPRLQVHAQTGRFARDYLPSPDTTADSNFDQVVYFLGSNDGIFPQTPIDTVVKARMRTTLQFYKDRGFRILVVLPAKYRGVEANMYRIRRALRELVEELDLKQVDMNPLWDFDLTLGDGLHPGPELSQAIARAISSRLR